MFDKLTQIYTMYFLLQHAYCHLITWLVLIPHTPTISRFFNVPFTCLYKVPVQSSIIYPETLSFIHSFRFYVNVNIIEYKFKDSTMLAMGGVRGSQGNLSMRRSMWRSMWGSMWRAMWHTWITDNNVLHVILNENWYLELCSNTHKQSQHCAAQNPYTLLLNTISIYSWNIGDYCAYAMTHWLINFILFCPFNNTVSKHVKIICIWTWFNSRFTVLAIFIIFWFDEKSLPRGVKYSCK